MYTFHKNNHKYEHTCIVAFITVIQQPAVNMLMERINMTDEVK